MTPESPPKDKTLSHKSLEDIRYVKSLGIYPYFREISSSGGNVVTIDGKEVLMMGSNSYLGLTDHPEVKKAAIEAVEIYGTGSSGSRFLNGSLEIHRLLEEELAELVEKPMALAFSTGFQANSGTISVLVGKDEYVITDKLDHASILDGCRLSLARKLRFKHNDMEDLEGILERIPRESGKLIVVDGVFSMEGDIINLPECIRLCREYNAEMMVDDAHGIGVLGENGAGTANHFGLIDDVKIVMGTFSKSLASLGGFVASDEDTIEYLKHASRTMMFSASISPPNTAAARAALMIMKREPERRERLWENTARMKKGLEDLGFDTRGSQTPIIPVLVGDSITTFKMCAMLQDEGVFVNPVMAPAVPDGENILRVSLTATHTPMQVDFALDKLGKVGRALNVI
jgi:8-amino-7-oxononanoate synthase